MFSKRIEKRIQILKSENFGELGEARNSHLRLVIRNRKDAIKVKRLVNRIAESFVTVMAYSDRCELHEWNSDYESDFYEYDDDLCKAYHERVLLRNKYRAFSKIRGLRKYLDLIYKEDITQMRTCTCSDFAILFNTDLYPEYKEYLYDGYYGEEDNKVKIYLPSELDNYKYYWNRLFDRYYEEYEYLDPNQDRILSLLSSLTDSNSNIDKLIAQENKKIKEEIEEENRPLEKWVDPFEDIDF